MDNLIIDAGNLLHRTYHSSKNMGAINSKGVNVSHVYTFLSAVKNIQKEFQAKNIYLCWDIRHDDFKYMQNFRQEAVEYKGHRDRSEHEIIHRYDDLLWNMCRCLGIVCMKAYRLEADDIVAWLALKHCGGNTVIASGDGDFLQLLQHNPLLSIYNSNKHVKITCENFEQHSGGVSVDKFLLQKAVMGDSSDNIKGLKMYGPVKSKKFVENFKENFKALSKDDQKIIKTNLEIMNLKNGFNYYDGETKYYEEQVDKKITNFEKFFDICEKLELETIVKYKQKWKDTFDCDPFGGIIRLF